MIKLILGSAFCCLLSLGSFGCGLLKPPVLENSPLRFTEFHYNPSPEQGDSKAEFVEVGNIGPESVDLSGWSITGIGSFEFPKTLTIRPGTVIVVCKDLSALRELSEGPVQVLTTFDGKLKDEGETITLLDSDGRIADRISYKPSSPIVAAADGTGNSLQCSFDGKGWKVDSPTPGEL
jgi:hypothetical protein